MIDDLLESLEVTSSEESDKVVNSEEEVTELEISSSDSVKTNEEVVAE